MIILPSGLMQASQPSNREEPRGLHSAFVISGRFQIPLNEGPGEGDDV